MLMLTFFPLLVYGATIRGVGIALKRKVMENTHARLLFKKFTATLVLRPDLVVSAWGVAGTFHSASYAQAYYGVYGHVE
eukprot:5358450-Prymnesium_polylepis.3